MSRSKLLNNYFVSHETLDKLQEYTNLLLKWNKKINLISKSSEKDIWDRHILDSAQLAKFINTSGKILDVGSGAGLPGIVLSILGAESITLVESDQRKSAFLLEVSRLFKLKTQVMNCRVENITNEHFDTIIARGFASVAKIFEQTSFLQVNRILLLKGKIYKSEILEAAQKWSFDYITHPSATNSNSYIIDIKNVQQKK